LNAVWLSVRLFLPGYVALDTFLKRHVRSSIYEPLVDEEELIHATPSYAHVRLQNGLETTVALRGIAPITRGNTFSNELHLDPVDGQGGDQSALNVSPSATQDDPVIDVNNDETVVQMIISITLLRMMRMTLLHLNRHLLMMLRFFAVHRERSAFQTDLRIDTVY